MFHGDICIQVYYYLLLYPAPLSSTSPPGLLHSLQPKLIFVLLSQNQADCQKEWPHASAQTGRFVKTEIGLFVFWSWIIFHQSPISLPNRPPPTPSQPPTHPSMLHLLSTWPPVAPLRLLSNPPPYEHTPTYTLSLCHLNHSCHCACVLWCCASWDLFNSTPKPETAHAHTHTQALIMLINAGHAGPGTWISKQRTETNAMHSCTLAFHTIHGNATVSG